MHLTIFSYYSSLNLIPYILIAILIISILSLIALPLGLYRRFRKGNKWYNDANNNGQPPYGQPPYGQPPYGQPPYGQPPYGQPPFGQPPFGQPPYGQPMQGQPYGQSPMGQPMMNQQPQGVRCNSCGMINLPEATFCQQCGNNLR